LQDECFICASTINVQRDDIMLMNIYVFIH